MNNKRYRVSGVVPGNKERGEMGGESKKLKPKIFKNG